MKNIFLIGYMGTGKTTVSKQLGRLQKMLEIDMDAELERRAGKKISDIFADEGEACFRQMEHALLQEYEKREGYVISCGGGVPLREDNVASMQKSGVIVLLTAEPRTVYERVSGNRNRPLLNGNMNEAYIAGMMEQRKPYYQKAADVTVATDGKGPREIAVEILKKIKGVSEQEGSL